VHREVYVTVMPSSERADWDTFFRFAGNPKSPTLEEAIQQALRAAAVDKLIPHLRPLVETKPTVLRSALAYVWVIKPYAIACLVRSGGCWQSRGKALGAVW